MRTVNREGPSAGSLFSFNPGIYVPIGASERQDLDGRQRNVALPQRNVALHIGPADDGIVRVYTYVYIGRDDADAIWRPTC